MCGLKKLLKNKKSLLFFAALLTVFIGGLFWWQANRETPVEKWGSVGHSSKEDYVIKDVSSGMIVENKKVGLVFQIPKNWLAEKDNLAAFYSSDAEFSETRSDVLLKGCRIEVFANFIKTNISTLKKYIDEDLQEWSSVVAIDEFQQIDINNQPALRYKYHVRQDVPDRIRMAYISADIPSEKYIYKILLSSFLEEIDKCEEEFDDFLKTISF
jgi:hypothetical protein